MKYNNCFSTLSILFLFQILFIMFPAVLSSLHVKHTGLRKHHRRSFPRQNRPTSEKPKYEVNVFDSSCKHTERNIYEIEYNEEEIRKVSLFRKDYRLESYVGYPCSTKLYEEFDLRFRNSSLNCPFRNNLEIDFQDFIWNELWNASQTNTSLGNDTLVQNSSLFFQYICFSNQFERCVPKDIVGYNGTCDGVCECMDEVPVQDLHYPRVTNTFDNRPILKKENEIRCGVQAGGLCFPVWDSECKPNEVGYNKTWETMYKKSDFFFKCESNAGCHTTKRICECAQGHTCGTPGGPFRDIVWFIPWIFTLIISSFLTH